MFGVSAMFGLTACGNSDPATYVWERTWSYQGVVDAGWRNLGRDENGNEGTVVEVLLERELKKDNLDLENADINEQSEVISTTLYISFTACFSAVED